LREITQSADVRTKLLDMGFEPFGGTADAFANDIKSQYPVWAGLVKAAGVKSE
jgi:tripartite-type tricarboxylate transporter receptor subunit TctC